MVPVGIYWLFLSPVFLIFHVGCLNQQGFDGKLPVTETLLHLCLSSRDTIVFLTRGETT